MGGFITEMVLVSKFYVTTVIQKYYYNVFNASCPNKGALQNKKIKTLNPTEKQKKNSKMQ